MTDAELTLLDEGVDVIIKPPAEALAGGHRARGGPRNAHHLWSAHRTAGRTAQVAEAQDIVLSYVRGHVGEAKKAPLCGNSIATDRRFIARDMPELDAYLHYRMVDVSSIKELARRWYPRAYFASPAKHGGHLGPRPTSRRASRNCGTTGRRCSSRSRGRIR